MRSLSHSPFLRCSPFARHALLCLGALVASVASAQGAIQVPTVAAQVQSVGAGFELDGVIEPVKKSIISAQAGGRIGSVLVKTGDKVRAGQLLATIDDREALTGMERSQAQVAQAQAELRNAQSQFDRTRELQSKGFVSSAALDTADSQLKSAKAGRDQAGAGAKQSALAQGFTRVNAPFDGWVLQLQVEAGDLAVPGKPLLTIYSPEPLRAVVQVPVSRSAAAQSVGSVEVAVPGANGSVQWIRPASLTSVPTADPVSQTIEWRLALSPDSGRALLPGQQVRVRFASGQQDRMVVPQAAVLRRGELTAVYVVSGAQFVLKAIRLGADQGPAGVEVLVGLKTGDRVALDPVKAGLAGAQPVAPQ
ncbi:MAG: efflux RND transporter periplasmic adaptor subunit [Rhodoferax sp.]|nr:efflux RND transporter periplasmic adaptor subunit [Rhodoferax sp.]MBP7490650.1 efflux RND transporter periplasmic adaptor subunit [Rhodoferax sp.]